MSSSVQKMMKEFWPVECEVDRQILLISYLQVAGTFGEAAQWKMLVQYQRRGMRPTQRWFHNNLAYSKYTIARCRFKNEEDALLFKFMI